MAPAIFGPVWVRFCVSIGWASSHHPAATALVNSLAQCLPPAPGWLCGVVVVWDCLHGCVCAQGQPCLLLSARVTARVLPSVPGSVPLHVAVRALV